MISLSPNIKSLAFAIMLSLSACAILPIPSNGVSSKALQALPQDVAQLLATEHLESGVMERYIGYIDRKAMGRHGVEPSNLTTIKGWRITSGRMSEMSFQEYSRLVAANFANLPTSWTDSFVHFAIDHINEQTLTAQILVTEGYQVKAYDTYWVLDITWTGTHWQKTALTVQRVPIPDEQQ